MYKKPRDCEISLWTLQDEFITVLKPWGIEDKKFLVKKNMTVVDDGTQELTFSIPLYVYEGTERIKNSLWHTVEDKLLLANLRKIKVIFNKDNIAKRKIFEFMIINVSESHSKDQLYCDIKCDGLAFHELGKVGYKISLSTDEFYNETNDWFENPEDKEEPRATLQYWNDKVFNHHSVSDWDYLIQMDWSSYRNGADRDSNKVYEEGYVSSWELKTDNDNYYIPAAEEQYREKERCVDIEESNVYNITQELAEAFGVFCRYEYEYDDNLHIIGKHVVYYNNYTREEDGYFDLTYPYSAGEIKRELNGEDISTKMYVQAIDDNTTDSGIITILDSPANKSREDYLLNFEYLYSIDGITEEQYNAVFEYENTMRKINLDMEGLSNSLIALQNQLIELEASQTLLTNSIQLDKERIAASNDLLNALDIKDGDADGMITIDANNPKTAILQLADDGSYSIKLTEHGIQPETLHIYGSYNYAALAYGSPELKGQIEYDENQEIIGVSKIFFPTKTASNLVYLAYKYSPKLYYESVQQTWIVKLNKDEEELKVVEAKLDDFNTRIDSYTELFESYKSLKEKTIKKFNTLMGPAIRESYWQPEDYEDYGSSYYYTLTDIYNVNADSHAREDYCEFIWDETAFEDETKVYYELGINKDKKYYPCIDLSQHLEYVAEHLNELSFSFYDFNVSEDDERYTPKNLKQFAANSTAEYVFIKKTDETIVPALMLTGVDAVSETTLSHIINSEGTYRPLISVVSTTIDENGLNVIRDEENGFSPNFLNVQNGEVIEITQVFPRFKINSLQLNTAADKLLLKTNERMLVEYEDYFTLIRDDSKEDKYESYYYITLKPSSILFASNLTYSIKYFISNLATGIYLDAKKVLQENSMPRVSYTISPTLFFNKQLTINETYNSNYNILETYELLNHICNINDSDLKFQNVQGYVSKLELDLDNEANDRIEIKNYKNKYENLFSSIIAQTEEMKKNEYNFGIALDAFTSGGNLTESVIQASLDNANVQQEFNNGKLVINNKEGIYSIGSDGVVALREGGIFTATTKDDKGNWEWNPAVLPRGLNASSLNYGQLNTNDINIYAGNDIKLQMNSQGLFAYKGIWEDGILSAESVDESLLDKKQYVVFNSEGLFLRADAGVKITPKGSSQSIALAEDVKRVEISWDGLKLRNWNNQEVFFADADTGDLTLAGSILAKKLFIMDDETVQEYGGLKQFQTDYDVYVKAKKPISVYSDQDINISSGSRISMGTTNGDRFASKLELSQNGIFMNGSYLQLQADSAFQLENVYTINANSNSQTIDINNSDVRESYIRFGVQDSENNINYTTIINQNQVQSAIGIFDKILSNNGNFGVTGDSNYNIVVTTDDLESFIPSVTVRPCIILHIATNTGFTSYSYNRINTYDKVIKSRQLVKLTDAQLQEEEITCISLVGAFKAPKPLVETNQLSTITISLPVTTVLYSKTDEGTIKLSTQYVSNAFFNQEDLALTLYSKATVNDNTLTVDESSVCTIIPSSLNENNGAAVENETDPEENDSNIDINSGNENTSRPLTILPTTSLKFIDKMMRLEYKLSLNQEQALLSADEASGGDEQTLYYKIKSPYYYIDENTIVTLGLVIGTSTDTPMYEESETNDTDVSSYFKISTYTSASDSALPCQTYYLP